MLDRAGVREGQSFILSGDGSYDLQLHRLLRELPSWGVRAENSVLGYARGLMLFVRFLETSRYGMPIWACDGDDLRAYKRVRLWCGGPDAASAGMSDRSVAALDKWVAWSLDAELLRRAPFRYVDKTVMTPAGPRWVRVNAEVESDPLDDPLRCPSRTTCCGGTLGCEGNCRRVGLIRRGGVGTASATPCSPTALVHSGTSPDPVWDLGPFLPRSTSQRTIVFTSVADPITALVLRESSGS
ncbi:hypothetical protein [Streptomyces sp. MN13]